MSLTPIESFDDLSIGQRFDFGTLEMTREEILDFAHRYDPQPFHVDAEAARGPDHVLRQPGIEVTVDLPVSPRQAMPAPRRLCPAVAAR